MPLPTTGYPVAGIAAPAVPPTPLTPVGSTANTLQATGFIPEIWSAKLVEKFYASTVLSAISNTDYEGEIQNQGDRVKIRTKPTITIKDYQADGLLGLDRPSGGSIELFIGIGKYFSLILDDVMEVQSDLNLLSMWSDDAAQQLKIVVDRDVLGGIVTAAAAKNKGAAAGAISGNLNLGIKGTPVSVNLAPTAGQTGILDVILRLGQALDEQNIPEQGRWIVMSAAAGRYIKQSELRQAYLSGDPVSMLRNGRLGMVDRFTIYISNLLPGLATDAVNFAAGEQPIYAGHAHGLTFASQISKVETLRSELTFGQILRGLQVYGYQVVDPTALAYSQIILA